MHTGYVYLSLYVFMYVYAYNLPRQSTGWRRLIGCLKLLVIFRKRATDYRALLRKLTYEDKASYESTPPCTSSMSLL